MRVFRWIRIPCFIWPNHLLNSEGLTPSQKVFQFLSRPYDLCDYNDPVRQAPVTQRGCQYLFRGGPKKGQMCGGQDFLGGQRCPFHAHVIFSPQFNDLLFQLIRVIDGGYTWDPFCFAQGEKIPFRAGLYIDPKKRLVYRVSSDSNLICVGYCPEGTQEVQPLTPTHLEQ